MSLDRVLESLLFHRSVREAFACDDLAPLDATAEEIDALRSVDRAQLERAARLACTGILQRSHRGSGSLVDAFGGTIAAWREAAPSSSLDDLAMAFTESVHFAHVRVIPSGEGAISLEEAFFRFAEERAIGEASMRKAELVYALARALVVTHHPSFELPSVMRRAPRGYFAVLDGPELVAALDGRLVRGRITPFLAALLEDGASPSRVAMKFDVAPDVVAASCTELRRLGLR